MIDVIVMTYYMSGDRNTIASALHLNRTWRVLVVGGDFDPRTAELEAFFQAKVGDARVRVKRVNSMDEARKVAGLAKRSSFVLEGSNNLPDEVRNEQRKGLEREVAAAFNSNLVHLQVPGSATTSIGEWFGKTPEKAREGLRAFWSDADYREKFEVFLFKHLEFHPEQPSAFLWCKTGESTAEKAHHFTDPLSWSHLAVEIAKYGWMPVVVGDPLPGVETRPSLVRFWDEWRKVFGEALPRDKQLAMWAFIAEVWGERCCSVGMRSGMLEVPGLVGIRTLYLEEIANQQRARMAQWLMKVTGWCRATLRQPPGLPQSGYWLRHMLTHQSEFGAVLRQFDASAELKARKREVTLYIAWVLKQVTGKAVHQDITRTISDYVDLDVRVEKYALSEACVRVIAKWVAEPKDVYQEEAMADRMVEDILSRKLLPLEGRTALPARKQAEPKRLALVGAADPWPDVAIGHEVAGTVQELSQRGFDLLTLGTLAPGKSARMQGVVWKCIRLDEGVKLVLKRQSPVLG